MHLLIDFSVKNAVLLAIDTALPEMADIKHESYFFMSVFIEQFHPLRHANKYMYVRAMSITYV